LTKGRLEKTKSAVMQRQAHRMGLDPSGDYVKPGATPAEQAYVVGLSAFDLLVQISHTAFPAVSGRTRRKGGKYLRHVLLYRAENGVEMLAKAIPGVLAATNGRLSPDQPAETVVDADYHMRVRRACESFYPVGAGKQGFFLERCLTEYRVMETHEPRPAVVEGEQSANEYSQALMRGENPDDDPELVRQQRDYARDYFIAWATSVAVRSALDKQDVKVLEEEIINFWMLENPKAAAKLRERALATWLEGVKPYLELASVDAKAARPEPARTPM
jgi:hypothetical protein